MKCELQINLTQKEFDDLSYNEKEIIGVIKSNPFLTKKQIATFTEFQPSTVGRIIQRLKNQGVLCEKTA